MADSEVRRVELVGGQAKDLMVKRRRTRRRVQEGGEEMDAPTEPSVSLKITKVNEVAAAPAATNGPSSQELNAAVANTRVNVAATNNVQMANATATNTVAPMQSAGATRVILKSKAKRTTKVLLKKKDQASGAEATSSQPKAKVARTKTRKIILHAPVKRLNKTRHAIKEGKSIPLDKLRALLIEKKLIKPTSKAPEPILRQIYTDSLIVAKKTL